MIQNVSNKLQVLHSLIDIIYLLINKKTVTPSAVELELFFQLGTINLIIIPGAMIPQRVILGVMSFFGIVVAFLMRACLSVAITEMVIPANSTSINNNETLICPANSLSVESSSESKTVSETFSSNIH